MIIESFAGEQAAAIRSIAQRAQSEEDLRIGVEQVLQSALQHLGIDVRPRYERSYAGSVLRGRSDAVYGHAVIEYERVGVLSRSGGVRHAAEQLERYLRAEAGPTEDTRALQRSVGIGLDGERIFFLRYRLGVTESEDTDTAPRQRVLPFFPTEDGTDRQETIGSFQILGPYPVSEESIKELLLYMRALRRRPLSPEALAEEFGPTGDVARCLVATLYGILQHTSHPKAQTFYGEWDRLFGIVYGQDLDRAEKDAQALARTYGLAAVAELKPLFFAVHTYYALLMKLLASELASLQHGSLMSSIVSDLPALSDREICERLAELEDGGLFARLGITNFLEGDLYGWYLAAWEEELGDGVRQLARILREFEPATGSLEPGVTRDLLKKLYQYLVPKELRHDLGEYYTPDWLAGFTLNESGYDGDVNKRVLDPACGSGTFLVLAIQRVRAYADEHLLDSRQTVRQILANIVGFDLNPLAVIAARTNYLLALGPLVRYQTPLEIPVYLCDSVLTPARQRHAQASFHDDYQYLSTVGTFHIPRNIVAQGELSTLAQLLEHSVRHEYSLEDFLSRARRQLRGAEGFAEASLGALFSKMSDLQREGRNGIWARIVKNAFAPVLSGTFDYVVGNPPWVNWQSLSDEYRRATIQLWQEYGLFTLKGHAARLGGGKKDIAMLMLYAAADNYLRDGGRLAFVITQTLFKTRGAGDGFRRFRLGDEQYLKVLRAQDMSELQPFEGATNRTATILLEKGEATTYPVPYLVWHKTKAGRLGYGATLSEVRGRTAVDAFAAEPVAVDEPTSPWITAPEAALRALRRVIGLSPYRAYAGSYTGGLNGVFWVRVVAQRADGLLIVENLHDVGKTKVKRVQEVIEPDLVFPLLRGRDVDRWRAQPSASILVTQDPRTRTGYDETWMKVQLPHTYAYLKQFEEELRTERRSSSLQELIRKGAFYSMYAVADYTFSANKVVWREQASDFTASAAIGEDRPWIPDHKLMLVPCATPEEAYYLAACLNSSAVRLAVGSYVVSTSTSTHVLGNIAVPKYDPDKTMHQRLARLGKQAHEAAERGYANGSEISKVEANIDQTVAALFGITREELAAIRVVLSGRSPGTRRASDSRPLAETAGVPEPAVEPVQYSEVDVPVQYAGTDSV